MKKLLFAILFGLSLLPVLSVTAPSAQAREVVVREHRAYHGEGRHSYRHHYRRAYHHRYQRHHYVHHRHHGGSGVSVSIER